MALSASLFLRQSQTLAMTPQLMQSIQLLQMTHLELTHFIEQEVEKNPLLEFVSGDESLGGDRHGKEDFHASEDGSANDGAPAFEALGDVYDSTTATTSERMSEQLDSNFENVFPDDMGPQRADAPELLGQWKSMPGSGGEEGYDLEDFVANQTTLRDFLDTQIPFCVHGPTDRLIAQQLADHLDDAGYLHADIGEIADRLGTTRADVARVLENLQQLDPPGVFARNLSECLAIQLRQRDRLDPKPGTGFEAGTSESIIPDIVVRAAADGSWAIELNPETLPRVLVNQSYYTTVCRHTPKNSEDHAFLSECLQTANWLTRSLDQRARTIMKVATEIVRQQDAFLVHGVDHLRPLNLKTVADAIKMHESTVSRVTSNKYMLTPRGLFELKYFFTVSIGSAEGGDAHSAESVRHRIRNMITLESPDAVLSDDDIVDLLKKGGIDIARRTVAKYREAMNIPSSVQRRREKRAMAKVSA
ncbi:RNA polymerase factor sigma-54 [Pararhizobium arenae]|uniref:RNA polymerase factor sigma-54 n=1 Tax=Pararhizobium arenae TaxID=1856850 RepID=UPI00094B4EE9|nr:RNA polymerase sigma-54 factor [Pararhizobium arenae]